jgi:isopenicillin-N N-acyltransferase-like protein
MIQTYVSAPAGPRERGLGFGAAHAGQIATAVDRYRELFAAAAGRSVDMEGLGEESLGAIAAWAPESAEEIRGMAEGADIDPRLVAALNARTEILALAAPGGRGECSSLVALGASADGPAAAQTWDWHEDLRDSWLVWTIEHPDGRVVHTLTEFGIVGKIGVSSRGIGVLFNILHHARDGRSIGVPVHVVARRILDSATDLSEAVGAAAAAEVSASSALTVIAADGDERAALTLEVHPGGPGILLPDERGVLVHTNHFLTQPAALEDREPRIGPDSFWRYDILRRRLRESPPAGAADLVDALTSHLGGAGAVCCHPAPDAPVGERWATLATITLDVARGAMEVRAGGPCDPSPARWSSAAAAAPAG